AGHIRKVFENKKEFRVDAVKAGLRIPKGATLLIKDLTDAKWEEFKEELGDLPAQAGRLVFQLTDYTIGGGLGTFFIDNKEDLKEFREFVERRGIHPLNNNKQVKGRGYSPSTAINRNSQGRVLEFVNVTERIEGRQASIAGCATFYGTVACVLQNQIMDQPELAALAGRSGVWLGQDWHVRFSEKAQLLAEKQVKKWGEYIYKKGYKGIFGLDLIVTNEDEVYAIECNSRYTGAFPVLTMAQLVNKEMPIDVWHLLEWMGVEYEMDIDEVQEVYREPKKGAFVLLHNLERKFVTPTKTVKAGVWGLYSGPSTDSSPQRSGLKGVPSRTDLNLKWVRPGFSLLDIKNEDEFILCDRVPTEEMVLKPAERMGRLIFNRRIVTDEGELLDWTRGVIKAIYDKFELGVVSARAVS
ncbi:MAG: ATP-grasp domain-containing protein, partial [Candidatus Beckwithbacteria bacterium]